MTKKKDLIKEGLELLKDQKSYTVEDSTNPDKVKKAEKDINKINKILNKK